MSTVDVTEEEQVRCNNVRTANPQGLAGSTTLSTSTPQKEPGSALAAISNASIAGTSSTRLRRSKREPTVLRAKHLFARFEQEISPSHATTSARREKMAFKSLTRLLGHLEASRLGPHEAYQYRKAREQEGIQAGTLDYELRLLRQVFSTARALWGAAYADCSLPVVRGVRPRIPLGRSVALDESQVRRLLLWCAPELASVVTVALETGLRISELVALTADQIDFDKGLITIEQQKNGKRSVLPLSQTALGILRQSTVQRGGPVFLRRNGQAWTGSLLREHFKKAITEAGIRPCRFHDLRHTFATRLLERGVSMHTVQKLGRWSSVVMLQRYGHYDVEHLREALDASK